MEEIEKECYEAPTSTVVAIKIEGIICQSDQYTIPGYGDVNEI